MKPLTYLVALPPLVKAASIDGQMRVTRCGKVYRACAFDQNGHGYCAEGISPELAISALESELGKRGAGV